MVPRQVPELPARVGVSRFLRGGRRGWGEEERGGGEDGEDGQERARAPEFGAGEQRARERGLERERADARLAQDLDVRDLGVVVLGDFRKIEEGQTVERTGEILSVPVGDVVVEVNTQKELHRLGRTYLNNLRSAQSLACLCSLVCSSSIIQLLPFLLEVIHRFLLFLTCSSCVEADKVPRRIEFEALWSVFGVNADQYHCC